MPIFRQQLLFYTEIKISSNIQDKIFQFKSPETDLSGTTVFIYTVFQSIGNIIRSGKINGSIRLPPNFTKPQENAPGMFPHGKKPYITGKGFPAVFLILFFGKRNRPEIIFNTGSIFLTMPNLHKSLKTLLDKLEV